MRRITHSSLAIRVSLLTALMLVMAAVMPLVALASQGDPVGY